MSGKISDDHVREMMAALRVSRLPGVGARGFRALIERLALPSRALEECERTPPRPFAVSAGKSSLSAAVNLVEQWLQAGGCGWYFGHSEYPVALSRLSEPPPVLFVRGKFPVCPLVAVVGARVPTSVAEGHCTEAVRQLVRSFSCGIVSGGAKGIDGIAHTVALEEKRPTVAVLGTGIDILYPPENRELLERISREGALLSELFPGAPPRRDFFPTRNRIVVGLAEAVIVIQAGQKSGTMISARMAQRFQRPLLVLAPPEGEKDGWEGNYSLLEAGARGFTDAAALIKELSGLAVLRKRKKGTRKRCD
jgi:DNA processing protein